MAIRRDRTRPWLLMGVVGEKESWKDKTGDRSSFFCMAGFTLTENLKVNLGVFVGRSAQQSIPLPDGQNSPANLNMSMR